MIFATSTPARTSLVESAMFDLEDIFDEDEVEEIKRVNKGPRPGG